MVSSILAMQSSFRWSLPVAFLLVSLLTGCAGGNAIRGQLTYDLRPEAQRTVAFWPPNTDVPRYRYIGELIGEPNFVDVGGEGRNPVIGALRWWAGVDEIDNPRLLRRPQHGTVGADGRIYVVDTGRNALFVFDPRAPKEEESDRGAGQLLTWEFADQRTRFQGPVAVSAVWGGDLAVSDAALGFVARLDRTGAPVGQIGMRHLRRPTGLAFDASRGLLFVADTAAHDIKVYDEAGQLVNTVGSPGDRAGEFNAPTQLAFAAGFLYVSDTLNSRVQVFDADGRYLRHFGERGLRIGNLSRPKGVAIGEGGIVYVVESYFNHLLAYTEDNQLLLGINGSGLKDGTFLLPAGVWTDNQGRVFVADMFNARIVVFQFLGHDGG
jgi:sugar lactone lactonase YvrE